MVTTETLAALLDRAIDATQVMDRRNSAAPSLVDMNTYRLLLRSCRESYNPSARMYAYLLQPVVQDAEIKGQLTDTIKEHLEKYIHDDQIQSAVFAIFGGGTGGFKVDDLVGHWLDIAIARGSDYAANAFLEGLKNRNLQYQKMTLLKGLRTDHEITVSNGIRLLPLPNSPAAFPHYLPELYGPMNPSPGDFVLDTILVVDASVSPVFVNPTETLGDDDEILDINKVFEYEDASDEPLGFDTKQFCEALSLVAGGPVRPAVWWSHLDEDHICKVRKSYGGFEWRPAELVRHLPDGVSGNLTEETIQEAMSLYRTRKDLDTKVEAQLAVPIDRWIRSHTDTLLVDKFIDLGIALESLYLKDGNTSELRFRLGLYAAWHLGTCSSERLRLVREFRTIYDLRSKAVHTGVIAENPDTQDTLAKAQDHCRQAIIKFITDGKFPDWDRLVISGHDA